MTGILQELPIFKNSFTVGLRIGLIRFCLKLIRQSMPFEGNPRHAAQDLAGREAGRVWLYSWQRRTGPRPGKAGAGNTAYKT